MVKVSVIIPVYNVEPYLKQCMDSVVGQTLKDIEIICVDDGSTDNSLDILREYAAEDSRIQIIEQKNAGAGAARNNGMRYATGKYLSFLDSDDFYVNSNLIKLVEKLKGTNADLVFTNYRRDKGKISVLFRPSQINYDKISSFDTLNLSNVVNFAMHGIAYKTSILKNNAIELSTGISYTDSEYCSGSP